MRMHSGNDRDPRGDAAPSRQAVPGADALPRTLELKRDAGGGACLCFIDQNRLPGVLATREARCHGEVVEAIKSLAVRGAPAIGVAGAAAVALFVINESKALDVGTLLGQAAVVAAQVAAARPTAVNLSWGAGRVMRCARRHSQGGEAYAAPAAPGAPGTPVTLAALKQALFDEVKLMEAEDEATNRRIGLAGAPLIPEGGRVLTHCNAGSLATVFFGTALGVVYTAAAQGRVERVYAGETRPLGQGARLTAWEVARAGIPCTLACDSMAATLMAEGHIDVVLVGADRICRNGDAANKVGTLGLAVLAAHYGIPFYVVAPTTTVDLPTAAGSEVVIEHRCADEVSRTLPFGVEVFNPAFDITPAGLITAIVTEKGVLKPSELAALPDEAPEGREV
ncbi:MAG: S-methyl-5-thioribose-1-phosphate isomerase [Eggerthellaceae bacterium]|jgi:methylthioribose-1-phosphate isomerase|nr:S-methyl-5-thioribose-1-phosphate isomerase [Eggerthellaceae bacterium]MDR2715673.1 S-methyl-5-thioribose-1-phosphate isomerase [Coriobacteriaceae bacterium]